MRSDPSRARARLTQLVTRAAVVLSVLALFGHYYSRDTGFTALIQFPSDGHSRELAIVQQIPHHDHRGSAAYDGQYYAQLAMDPLLRSPQTDRVLDKPSYRARRIFASWTAYVAGLGDPTRVLWAYAAQNLVVLILLAVLLGWTFPPTDWRSTAAWAACLLTPGLMTAVRYALPDALGATLIVAAVLATERRRVVLAAGLIAMAVLTRETFLVAIPMLWFGPDRRIGRLIAGTALAVVPMLLWQDYLYSIYRGGSLTTGGHLVSETGYLGQLKSIMDGLTGPWGRSQRAAAATGLSMLVQVTFVVTRFKWRSVWWWCGSTTGGLMLMVAPVLWVSAPRAFLPLALAFNALLPRDSRWFWAMLIGGNLFLVATLELLVSPWWRFR